MLMPSRPHHSGVAEVNAPHAASAISPVLGVMTAIIIAITCFTLTQTNQWNVHGYVGGSLAHGMVYLLTIVWLWKRPQRSHDLWLILAAAMIFRVIAMTSLPALSTDAFRYVWDGRIQTEGVNPYLYVPAAPQLENLRDTDIYPHINKKEIAHTIYPPMAQLIFWISTYLGSGLWGPKLAALVFEGVTVTALIRWLRVKKLPTSRVLIYAWHPLPIWEFASQGHIDSAATGLLVAGILLAQQKHQGWAGGILAAAALVKYFPVVLIPALWKRWDWRMPATFFATSVLLYLPYSIQAGGQVFGFLPEHLDAEGYQAGWGFHLPWFLKEFGIAEMSGKSYLAMSLVVLSVIAGRAFFQRAQEEIKPQHLMWLGASFVFLTSPHYPWYFGFLVALSVIHISPTVLIMTTCCTVLQVTRSPEGWSWTEPFTMTFVVPLAIGAGIFAWQTFRLPPWILQQRLERTGLPTHTGPFPPVDLTSLESTDDTVDKQDTPLPDLLPR